MIKRSIKRRLIKAKSSLHQTVQKILDINRKRKYLNYFENAEQKEVDLNRELRLLNKIAEHQHNLVRRYENQLTTRG